MFLTCYSVFSQKLEETEESTEFSTEQVGSNGTMTKSLPLLGVRNDALSVGLSLNYISGGGVQVSQLASRVGLGWNLGGIGYIKRQVKNIPDEGYTRNDIIKFTNDVEPDNPFSVDDVITDVQGWLSQPIQPDLDGDINNGDLLSANKEVADAKPDIFTFQVGAYSGSFIFSHESGLSTPTIKMLSHSNVLIEYTFDQANHQLTFTIHTPTGETYYLGGYNSIQNNLLLEERTLVYADGTVHGERPFNTPVTNVWFLDRIESKTIRNQVNAINFEYELEAYSYLNLGSEVLYMKNDPKLLDENNRLNDDSDDKMNDACDHYFSKEDITELNQTSNSELLPYQHIMYDERASVLYHYVNTLRPKAITSKYQDVNFIYDSSSRQDVEHHTFPNEITDVCNAVEADNCSAYELLDMANPTGNEAKALIGLELTNKYNGRTSKVMDITFSYDYFQGSSTGGPTLSQNYVSNDRKRLILKSYSVEDLGNNTSYLTTNFDYYLQGFGDGDYKLPRRLSYSQDYWGFYNGIYNQTLIPLLPYEVAGGMLKWFENPNPNSTSNRNFLNDCNNVAQRQASYPEMQVGVLKNITIPTGAVTKYQYEPHIVNNYPSDKLYEGNAPKNCEMVYYSGNSSDAICSKMDIGLKAEFPIQANEFLAEMMEHRAEQIDFEVFILDYSDYKLEVAIEGAICNNSPINTEIYFLEYLNIDVGNNNEGVFINQHTLTYNQSGIYEVPASSLHSLNSINKIVFKSNAKVSFKILEKVVCSSDVDLYKPMVGGLRLASVEIDNNDRNTPNTEVSFSYLNDAGTSSGKLLITPTYIEHFYDSNADNGKFHRFWVKDGFFPPSNAVCLEGNTIKARGRISSNSISPLINNNAQYVGYQTIKTIVKDNGFSVADYNIKTQAELGFATNTYKFFGVPDNVDLSNANNRNDILLQGTKVKERTFKESNQLTDAPVTESDFVYAVDNVSQNKYYSINYDFSSYPFGSNITFGDVFSYRLSGGFNANVQALLNSDGPCGSDHSTAIAPLVLGAQGEAMGGHNNILRYLPSTLLSSRVYMDELHATRDGVTTVTKYQYEEKNIVYNEINKKVIVPTRSETYTECDATNGDDCTKNVKSAQVTYFPISSKYEATDTYHDPNDPLNETATLFMENYLVGMPIEQQQWINTDGTYRMMEAAKTNYMVDNNNIVPKTTFKFFGNKWKVASNNTAWDSNTGMPTTTYLARQDALDDSGWTSTYKDWTIDYTKFNPDPVVNTYQDGLLTSTKKQDSSNSANDQETTYTYYNTRMVESETSPEGIVAYTAYDGFLRKSKVIGGIAAMDFIADQIPTTGRITQNFTYEIKNMLNTDGMPYNTNKVITTTTFENGATETVAHLTSQTDELLKDELGRDVSAIKKNYTPNNNDLIAQTNQYNRLGKVKESFTVGNGISTMVYETSLLSRIDEVQSSEIENKVETDYSCNDNTIDGTITIGTKTYNNHSLFKQTVTDIDGNISIAFTDFLGRSVLSRQIMNENGNTVYVDTGYEYDNKGRLSKIYPPDGAPYEYTYNKWGLMASKIVPNGGTTKYYYDYEFRLVLEIDAKGNKKVSVYDDFGRVIKNGTGAVYTADNSPVIAGDEITKLYKINEIKPQSEHYSVTYHTGTNYMATEVESILDASNTISKTTLSKTYPLANYDAELGVPTKILSEHHLNDGSSKDVEILEYNDAGEVWRSTLTHYDANNQAKTFVWTTKHDNGNRPVEVYFSNTNSSLGQLVSKLDYNENDQMVKRSLHSTGADFLQEIDYVYDGLGRLTDINDMDDYGNFNCATQTYCDLVISFENDNCAGFTLTKLQNGVEEDFQLSNSGFCPNQNSAETFITSLKQDLDNAGFIYDDVEVEWQDSPNLPQYVLYTVVITQSNAPFYKFTPPDNRTGLVQKNSCCGLNESQDLFAQRITYDNNGNSLNIGRIEWSTLCGDLQSYNYEYDDLKRLRFARYTQQDAAGNITGYTPGTTTTNLDGLFSVQIDYENLIGDIGNIYRNGISGQIDRITFNYANGQLSSTQDAADRTKGFKSINANGLNSYTYDNNGNIIKDTGKGLSMRYTYFNLPDRITRYNDILTNGDEDYTYFDYTGSGRKLRKSTSLAAGPAEFNAIKDYVGSIEYRNGKLDAYYHPDGMLKFNADGTYQYQYYIKDHLGNNRIVFTDTYNDDIVGSNDIIQENHHYPFGMQMNQTELATIGNENQYKYNGKEINEEFGLDWMAYGFRFYDAAIGRFTGVDPISDEFAHLSTYNYADNSPVANIDLHGLQAVNNNEARSIAENNFSLMGNPRTSSPYDNLSLTQQPYSDFVKLNDYTQYTNGSWGSGFDTYQLIHVDAYGNASPILKQVTVGEGDSQVTYEAPILTTVFNGDNRMASGALGGSTIIFDILSGGTAIGFRQLAKFGINAISNKIAFNRAFRFVGDDVLRSGMAHGAKTHSVLYKRTIYNRAKKGGHITSTGKTYNGGQLMSKSGDITFTTGRGSLLSPKYYAGPSGRGGSIFPKIPGAAFNVYGTGINKAIGYGGAGLGLSYGFKKFYTASQKSP